MNSLRELVLILSTFTWLGGGLWIAMAIVATDYAVGGAARAAVAPQLSYYVFGIGLAVFVATSVLWKKKKEF